MYHSENRPFTKDQLSKIGNTIIYLAKGIPELNKTKILKFLFLIEEASIKKSGKPFFGIDFQLWKFGPVAKDIFIDLSSNIYEDNSPILLKDFIERDPNNLENFIPKTVFSDDEFSDNDIKLLDLIIEFGKDKPAKYLVHHTHGTNSLWRKSAIKYGVLELLEKELVNSTEFVIDFSLLFSENAELLYRYEEARENLAFTRNLKS